MSLAGYLASPLRFGTPQSVLGSREQVRRLWRLPAPGVTVLPRLSKFWRPRPRAARRRWQPVPPRERHGLCRGHSCSWRVWWSRFLEAGPCRSALCRVASVGTICPTYLPRALFSCGPTLTGVGDGVASGATKLVPAFLSGLAQCREQCPSLIGKPCTSFTIRGGRRLRLPLLPMLRMIRGAPP